MESKASRSARVKLQLRDKKGRWIEMGSHIKWLNIAGQPIHGVAVDQKGQDVIAEVDSIENPGEKTLIQINRKKVEVIDAKAYLDGPAPDGDKEIPGEVKPEVAPEPVAAKYNATPGPTQIVLKTKDGSSITSLLGTLKVGDKVYPVGSGMKPYSNPTSTSGAAFKKYGSGGLGTITAIKEGKYATITDANGKQSFSSLKHYAVKQTPELDKALFDAHKAELDALADGGVGTPTESKWITALDPSAPKDEETKAELPPTEPPAAPAPAAADEPAFDATKSAVGDKVTLPDGEATKTAENTWKIPGKGNSLSDGQVNTYYQSANGNFKPLLDTPAPVEQDVVVSSNHTATPGSVRVRAADDKSPILVSVSSLKVGDKVYPISSLHNKPYGDHGNYNKKSTFVHTLNPAGIGTVVAKGSNYATVEGADGKTYYPTNNFVALKSTPGLDAKIEEVKATFDAPAAAPEAPEAPAAPEAQAPEAEAPAAPEVEAPAAPTTAAKKPIDISGWTKTGSQMGSNDGGVYTDQDGKQWYVKKPASNDHAMNEVLADDLYKAAGIETSNLQLADLGNGKLGTASPMLDGVQKNLSTKLNDKNYKKELQDGFAMDVLLANWDVVGLEFDNVVTNKDGKPVRVDPGGALLFRAMGSPKGDNFDKMASEWDTLRDSSTNSKSAKAFKDMTDEQLVESAKRVEYLTPGLIDAHVDASGFDDATKAKLKDVLKARRENIIQRAKAITPVEEQADEPIGDAPEAPAAPEATPEVTPEPVAPEPEPEAPVAPAPEPQPEAPAAPAPQAEPAPEPAETPAPEDDPFAGLDLKDKGKTVPDANGDLLKVGTKVTHSNGKNGKGIVTIIYPSTNSAKVYYENGVEQVANGKLLTPTAADVTAEPLVPASLSAGEVFFDTATGKTHIGAKDGTPLTAGSKVSYTKKGVTQTGTVKGIYKGQQTVSVSFDDGTSSTKKASALVSAEESAVDAPEIPEQDAPDVTPTTEEVTPEPEAPAAPEEAPEVPEAPEPEAAPEEAPAEPEALDGKVNPTADDLNALPVGAKIISDGSQSTYVKTEEGKWQPVTGDHGPYHTNMMVDGDNIAHGYKIDLSPDSAPESAPEAAPAEAPAANEPLGVQVIGKFFKDLTEDQISALPEGTMLKNTDHGHHWKKGPGNKWKAYGDDGKTVIGGDKNAIFISTGDLSSGQHNSLNQIVEVPGAEPVVDAPEANAPEAPSVDAPEAPAADLKSFEGKPFSDLTDEQMDSVPLGTKLISTGYGHYWKKESAEQWMSFDKDNDKPLTVPIENSKLKTEPWKSTHTLEFPKDETDATPEAAPEETPAPDETPEAVDVSTLEGEDVQMLTESEMDALPIGTELVGVPSVILKKTGSNEWKQYSVQDNAEIGTYTDLSLKQGTKSSAGSANKDVYKISLPKSGEDATPAAPEVETLDFPENVTTLPVGTVVPARTGSTVGFTKTADNKWEMVVHGTGIGQYVNDQFVQGVVDTTKPEIIKPSAPDALDEAAPDAPAALGDGPNKDNDQTWESSLKVAASELPVGSVLYTVNQDWKATKTADNKWESSNGAPFIDEDIDGVKPDNSYKIYIAPENNAAPETQDIADPWAAVDDAISATSTSGLWSDGPSASESPVGTKVSKKNTSYYIDKVDDNKWVSSSGTNFDDEDMDYFKKNPTYNFEQLAPVGPKTDLNEAIIEQFDDLPVGTKIYTGTAGWNATKTGPDAWVSAYGTDYSDQELIDAHNDGSTHSVAVPTDYDLPAGPAAPALKPGLAELVGKKYDDNSLIHGEDFPVGTILEYPGSSTSTLTKVGDNEWESAHGTEYYDSTVDGVKGEGMWTVKAIPGSDAPAAAPEATDFTEFVGKKVSETSFTGKTFPVGTVLEAPGTYTGTLTKTDEDTWEAANGTKFGDSIVEDINGANQWSIKSMPGGDTPTSSGYKDGDLWETTGVFADVKGADLPVGSVLDSGAATLTKTGPDSWDYSYNNGPVSSHYNDSDIDTSKSYGGWKYKGPATGTPAAEAAPAAASDPVTLTHALLADMPKGTKIVDESGYTLKKGDMGGVNNVWIPVMPDGKEIKFKDGDTWASATQLLPNGSYFPDASWTVYPPGTDVPGSTPTSTPSTDGIPHVSYVNMSESDIMALADGSIMVASDGPQKGYVLKVKKILGGTKLHPLNSTTGEQKAFVDGVSYAAPYEVTANVGTSGFNGNFDVYPAGTDVPSISGNPAAATPAASSGAGVLHPEMGASEMHDLPDGTLMVAAKGQHAGYIFKVQNPNGGNAKLIPLNKETGEKMSFTDGDSFAAPYEVENGGPVEQWQDNDGDFTIYPAGTTVAQINGAAPATPAGPEVPTGSVGSATNPAVVAGKTINAAILDAYPKGTTIKKENNSTYPSEYYFIKNADGTWDMKKKGKDYVSNKPADWVASNYFNSTSTATVHQPKPYGKHAVLGTGEIAYAGDTVTYKGDTGYIKSITNAGAINVQVNGKSGPKAPSTLSKSATNGLKTHIANSVNGVNTPAPAPTTYTPSTTNSPSAVTTANFAGASADDYNAAGVTVKGNINTPKSGVGVVSSGPVDKSNPLYGAPKPLKPEEPAEMKWDSAEWLKKVEERYAANPNKQKATLQDSNNWNTVKNVLEGHAGSLDKLLSNSYLTQEMFDEAKNGIEQHEASIKPLKDAHQAALQEWNSKVEEWLAANPSSNQFVDAKLPETSKEAFTGGPADWSKAAVGTYSADAAIAAVKLDAATANHGLSVATDSDQIEDLNVKFNRILDTTGEEVLEVKFKVTPLFGKDLLNTMQGKGAQVGSQIYLPKMVKDENTGLMKDTATSYSNSMAYTSGKRVVLTDSDTGAKVIFSQASNADNNTPHTMSNNVRILMPKGSTSAEYQKVLENLGIKAKPATAGDIKVLAENKFISVMGGNHEYKKNYHGDDRQKNIDKIKAKYGVSPDDLHFGVDSHGQSKFFYSDEAVAKLQAYTKVSGFKHNLMGSGTASEQFFAMITGAQPGLLSTYQRWTHGIHASGMSSSSDMASGAGDFMYTKVLHSTTGLSEGGNSVGINAKAALKRIDVYGNQHDAGNGQHSTGSPSAFDLMKGTPYEIQFKHSIPLSEWSHINISSEAERQKLIKRLTEHGITKINGIPLENFILTSGMKIPEIDPSFYNVVSG